MNPLSTHWLVSSQARSPNVLPTFISMRIVNLQFQFYHSIVWTPARKECPSILSICQQYCRLPQWCIFTTTLALENSSHNQFKITHFHECPGCVLIPNNVGKNKHNSCQSNLCSKMCNFTKAKFMLEFGCLVLYSPFNGNVKLIFQIPKWTLGTHFLSSNGMKLHTSCAFTTTMLTSHHHEI